MGRYTSYGRHFTKEDRLEKLCNLLKPLLRAEDLVVDFSCGSNEFLHMLNRMCIMDGFSINCKAFDIITPFHMEFFAGAKSWFDVTEGNYHLASLVSHHSLVGEACASVDGFEAGWNLSMPHVSCKLGLRCWRTS